MASKVCNIICFLFGQKVVPRLSEHSDVQCCSSPTEPPSKNAYRGTLTVMCKKKFDDMLHLAAEWSSKQNILIADTIFGRIRPVARF